MALTARKPDELDRAVAHLAGLGVEASGHACDIGKPELIADLVDGILAHYGKIDILVNNAGASWGAPAEDHSLDGWNKPLAVNMTGSFVMSQQVARKAMIPAKAGRILMTASVAGPLTTTRGCSTR